MVKAVIFDFFGVLESSGRLNTKLLDYIKRELRPGYQLAIITNSSGRGMRQLLAVDLMIFDTVLASGEVGLAKPSSSIYQLAAKRLGAKPSECVYVDDSLPLCQGARSAGIQAIHYQDFARFKTELESLLEAAADN